MASQQLLFTVLPRAMAVNTATLPVSVFVSPRLSGAQRLDAYPDWLHWTAALADRGLRITIKCGAQYYGVIELQVGDGVTTGKSGFQKIVFETPVDPC